MQRFQFLKLAAATVIAVPLLLSGCGDKKTSELKVGATAGPHAANVQKAAEVAKKQGLNVKVIEFTDYISPNKSLEEGSLDIAIYQHEPFLNNFNKQQGTHLKNIGVAVVQPMGFYSKNIHSLKEIPEGATFAIPNDPSNEGRGLQLIEKAGLIKLQPGKDGSAITVADIIDNPKHLKFKELEAAQLPRSLSDVDIATIPMNYVISAGLSPEKDGFYYESKEAPYALIIIAARENNANNADVQKFVKAFQSPEVAKFIKEEFKGAVVPAWE